MPLTNGTRLGPYEITSLLGQGGMGEVYKARDTRLNRTVAIKVLRDRDPHLRERFARESHIVAALQHPHICTIHDVGTHEGVDYIVMEYLDGETIKGPLPPGKVIDYGVQIADALDAAHTRGITHRDLKPANIVVTRSGAKVLDFGIARMSGAATLTQTGVVVGTPAYMAPEQWSGDAADARTDIYALGNVLKEIATGQIEGDARIEPPVLEWIIRKCLSRNPDDRWQSARDVRSMLEWARTPAAPVVPHASRPVWMAAGLLVAGIAVGAGIGWLWRRAPAVPLVQLAIAPPADAPFVMAGNFEGGIALSPDGTMIAFVARTRNRPQLWIRRFDSASATPLPGTEGAYLPFWSPDSRQIAFYTPDRLLKVPLEGGPVQMICRTDPRASGGAWMSNDVIVVSGRPGFGLHRINAAGGESQHLVDGSWPHPLPDGQRFLYTAADGIWVASVDSGEAPRRILEVTTTQALYSLDHVLFVRDRKLIARGFDPATLHISEDELVVAPVLLASLAANRPTISVTDDGVLAYAAGDPLHRLRWRTRDGGKLLGDLGEPAQYLMPRISPDGTRVAFAKIDNTNTDIWVADADGRSAIHLTFSPDADQFPIWSPDGKFITFASGPADMANLFQKAADGTGGVHPLTTEPSRQHAMDWSSDGQFLSITRNNTGFGTDLHVLPLAGDRQPYLFKQTTASEAHSQFRPGIPAKWIAYSSDDPSGRREIYVTGFTPGQPAGAFWQVSTDGGTMPRWRGDGRELYYWALDGRIMAVEVVVDGAAIRPGAARPLFAVHPPTLRTNAIEFDVDRRGERFLFVEPSEQFTFQPLTFVSNWLTAARR